MGSLPLRAGKWILILKAHVLNFFHVSSRPRKTAGNPPSLFCIWWPPSTEGDEFHHVTLKKYKVNIRNLQPKKKLASQSRVRYTGLSLSLSCEPLCVLAPTAPNITLFSPSFIPPPMEMVFPPVPCNNSGSAETPPLSAHGWKSHSDHYTSMISAAFNLDGAFKNTSLNLHHFAVCYSTWQYSEREKKHTPRLRSTLRLLYLKLLSVSPTSEH